MNRLQDHSVALLRLYAGGDAIVSWYNSFSDPSARLFSIAQTHSGGVWIWLMGLLGIIIVFDVLINDWTPSDIRIGGRKIPLNWRRVFVHRHWLFVVLALCYGAQPFVAEMAGGTVSLVMFFYWNSLQNITIAFFDVKQRLRSPMWQRACS